MQENTFASVVEPSDPALSSLSASVSDRPSGVVDTNEPASFSSIETTTPLLDMPRSMRGVIGNAETIEQAMLVCASDRIQPSDLPTRVRGLGSERGVVAKLPDAGIDLRAAVESFENDLIRQALDRTGWNKNQAANLLGLNRTTLVEMLKRKRLCKALKAAAAPEASPADERQPAFKVNSHVVAERLLDTLG
jgi:hypothetical protein